MTTKPKMGNGIGVNLWLDDARPAPQGWDIALSYEEAVTILETGRVVEVSLDYDLYLEETAVTKTGLVIAVQNIGAKTGYDVARWIESAVKDGRIQKPIMHCHSTNPLGQSLIAGVIERLS